mgnify:CR=1 FL=1
MALDDAKAMEVLPRAFAIRWSYPSLDPPSGSSQELHVQKDPGFLEPSGSELAHAENTVC